MNSALHSKEYFSRYLIALVCFICVHSPTESHSGYKDSIKGVISGIKDELTKSKNRTLMHEKAIKNSKTKILALAGEEKKLEEELKHLKNKSLKLTIALQKIAAQPIFSSFLTPTHTLSMARAINLITYLQNELATAEVRLGTKLTESSTLKNKINLERIRFEKTARELKLLNKKITSLITKHDFLLDRKILNDAKGKTKIANLSVDLQQLLFELKNGNKKKDAFINTLEKLSKDIKYKQSFSNSSGGSSALIAKGPLKEWSADKKLASQKVGFLSPRSFLENKHNVSLPVEGEVVKLFGQTDSVGLTTKGITVSTRPGARVVASFDGKVIYAGSFRTYGNILIIDHGEGFSTLLVGLGYIGVTTDQVVLGGEPVGKMENITLKNEEINQKLYIELRKHGKPIDPMAWLS